MTSTDKRVTRVTTKEYPERNGVSGNGYGPKRRIAVTIIPGDTLGLRPLRTRRTVYVSIEDVYRFACRREALSLRAQKMNAKRRAA